MTNGGAVEEWGRAPSSGWREPLPPTLAVAAAYAVIALAVTWPLASNPGGLLLDDPGAGGMPGGDVNCFLWAFWWFRWALAHHHLDVFHTPLMAYPEGLSLVSTPIAPLCAFASLALQPFLSAIAIYNLFVMLSLASTAFFTFLFARATGASRPAAFVSGCVFGFTTYHLAHSTHLNLLCTQWMPMTLWAVWRGLETRRVRWAVLAGLGVAFEAYSCWYLSVFLAVLLFAAGLARGVGALTGRQALEERRLRPWFWAAAAVCVAAMNWNVCFSMLPPVLFLLYGIWILAMLLSSHPRRREHRRNLLVFCVVAAASIAPLYARALQDRKAEATAENAPLMSKLMMSAEPWTYIMPPALVRIIDERCVQHENPYLRAPIGGESDLFPGCVVWALCLIVAWRRGRRARQNWRQSARRNWRQGARQDWWWAIAAAFAILSLGVGLKSFGNSVRLWSVFDIFILPGMVFDFLPLVSGLRAFSRFGVVVQLAMAAWLAANLDGALWREVVPGSPRRAAVKRWAVASAVAAALLLERFHTPHRASEIGDAAEFRRLAGSLRADTVLLGLPLENAAPMMYCQTRHGLPMLNFFGARVQKATRERFENAAFHHLLSQPLSPQDESAPPPAVAALANVELRRLGVGAVLLHRGLVSEAMEGFLDARVTRALGWRERERAASYVLYEPPATP